MAVVIAERSRAGPALGHMSIGDVCSGYESWRVKCWSRLEGRRPLRNLDHL
jgi:hypothetical protein